MNLAIAEIDYLNYQNGFGVGVPELLCPSNIT